ncbi:hypothetical protein N9K35_04380 [Pseudomonadales bacterium]|nr:hypothetical protein [Pseudomonadales bacterium]
MNINFQYRVEQELSERLSPAGRLHSQLAMRAAKGMAVTRQKSRHGRVVCHHLLRMLSSERSRDGKVVSEFQLTAPVTEAGYSVGYSVRNSVRNSVGNSVGNSVNNSADNSATSSAASSAASSATDSVAVGFQRHGPRVSAQAQQYSLGF